MSVENQFAPLFSGEVLSVDESTQLLIGNRTFRVDEFLDVIRKQLAGSEGWNQDKDAWFSEQGISAEVLRFKAKSWQKGTVRISLEFRPEESESQNPAQELDSSETTEDKGELPMIGMMS